MKLNPLTTKTGRQVVSTWLWAISDTFNLLGNAARKKPKPEPTPAPTWYSKVEKP